MSGWPTPLQQKRESEKALALPPIGSTLVAMNDYEVQCPSCGEWFAISPVAPEDYGSQLDYDCEVC